MLHSKNLITIGVCVTDTYRIQYAYMKKKKTSNFLHIIFPDCFTEYASVCVSLVLLYLNPFRR